MEKYEIREALNIFSEWIDDIYTSTPDFGGENESLAWDAVHRFCDYYGYNDIIFDACWEWLIEIRQ